MAQYSVPGLSRGLFRDCILAHVLRRARYIQVQAYSVTDFKGVAQNGGAPKATSGHLSNSNPNNGKQTGRNSHTRKSRGGAVATPLKSFSDSHTAEKRYNNGHPRRRP